MDWYIFGELEQEELYPNPAIDEVNITIDILHGETGEISIVDLQGKVLRILRVNASRNIFNINTNEFKSGVYLVKYMSNTGSQSIEKLMISK